MIKNTLAVAFIFLLNTHVFAQGEANNWFFGGGAGLVFDNINGTVTPTAAASQTINTLEGCSSISDPNGNLKFYTDGRDVWDANHNIMPNANYFAGTGLLGDPSSTSSGVIIPKPGDLDKYYIFTVDEPHHQNAWAFPNQGPTDINGNPTSFYNDSFSSVPAGDDGFNNGLNYSLVDMTLNNGMGDIDSSEKNIQLQTYDPLIQEHLEYKCAEKITAVEHADGQSYWVLTHFVDTFYAFRIDSNGVNLAPVTSTVAPSISVSGYRRNGIGYLKSSPNGNILAISHSQNSNIEGSNSGNGSAWLYDFDKETGLVSNPLQVDSNDNFYGVAFSQNSEKVYFSSSNGVQQFDLTSADIPSSATSIYQTSSGFMGAMQLGPDGKIYICNPIFDFTLDVINAPNETGTSVNYVEAGQQLSPGTSASYGLPPFIQSFLVANISYVNDCLGSSTEFYLSTSETIVSLEWDFGDSVTSTDLNPTHVYNLPGEYTVSVTITTTTEVQTFDTLVTIFDTPTANAVNDINVCDDDNDGVSSFDFNTEVTPDVLDSQDAASFSVSYHASQQDADDNQNPFSNPYINTLTQETVFVRIENVDNTDCFDTTSFDIEVFDTPVIAAINDLQNCDDGADGDLTNEQMDTDLSQLNSVVLGTQDTTLFSVSYHLSSEDATTGTNGLPLTYYNTTASEQTLFVRIENVTNTDCFATQDFKLIINTTPTANAVNDINVCDDDNDGVSSFDFNTEVTPDVLDSQDAASFSVSYHASQQDADDNQNPFSNPYINTLTQETVFVRIENVDNTDCFDTTSFDIEVFDTPVLPVDFEYYQCDYSNPGDLEEEFDLTALNGSIANGQDVTITHYESELDAENGTNPITNLYTNTSTSQTLYVQMVSNIFPECKAVGPYTIGVDPLPNVVVNVPLVQCDIDNVQDGISIYNLEEAAENLVVGDDPTNYALTFHLSQTDLDAGINAIADPTSYVNLSPLQTIFVRVENIATTCYTTSFFYLETIFNPIPDDAGLIVCDNSEMNGNDYDGLGLFTLSDANNYILSLIVDNPNNDITDPNQLTIAYYTSEIDALLELNQLPNQYISEVPDTQTLFIRVERGNDCFGINSIQLQVLPVPEYNEVDDEILCTYTPGSIAIDLSDYDAAVLGSQDASEVIITYHTTQEDADTGVNALVSPYTVFDQITLFVREEVQNNDPSVTACFISNVNFTLTVEPRPEFGVPIPLIVCDDDGVLDGLTTLDISVQTELIAAGIEDNIVSYHLSQEDANSGNNPLDTIYTTVVPDLQTIFVRIVNDLTAITGCYSTTPFDLVVVSPPNAITPNDFEYCDEDADGYGLFDLTELDAEITGTLSNLIISYHETEAEALNNVNAIVGDYSNIVPYQQTIYVRIEDTTITTPCYRYLEFQLIVNDVPQIELNPEPLEVCDDDTDGFAVFDLSLSDTEILNGLDPLEFEITYYETFVDAELKQNELLTPLNFTNTTPTTQTIFVRVENLTTECFKAIALPLIVNPLPVIIQPVPLELCDDAVADQITIFDLTDKNLEITNSDGSLEVVYYTTLLDAENATNAIADPTTYTNTAIGTAAANPQTLHVRVTDLDTGCYDLTTLTIRVLPNPTPNMNPDNLIACDDTNSGDGIEVFDLTTYETLIVNGEGNVSPTYHQSLEDALDGLNAIPNPTNYSNTETPLQTIYVRVTNDLTACFTVLDFDLIVNPIPNAIAIDDFIACELNTDDVYDFDLESQSSLILGGQDPALFEVTYHTNLADADSGINFLGSPYTNISDPQTIYISVENINTGCRNTTVQFNLAVHEAALASSPLAAYTLCDDNVETDGNPTNDRVQFDLSTQNNFVLNGQDPVDYTVRYYASQSDADQAINELPTLFENSVNPQLIIARVDNDTQVLDSSGTLIDSSICYETAEVTLEVNPLPVVEIEDDYLLCVDLNGTEVLSPLVIDTGLSNTEHTFIWRDASGMLVATNSNYAPVQGGTYTLEVFDDTLSTQCAAPIETFTVIESTPPIVTAQVTTAAFANTHVIEAVATGQGQYEYSLDQGPWGDSGTFIDVTPGEHLVTVRDINGCGESEAFVYVIDYPKYFTPNGDGYHDSWNINAVSNQVNAKIYIFDRLGKLIKEIRPSGTGWDGTYNGTLLPSSDYWFTLNYIDPTTANPEVLRAHFSLKR